MGTERIEELRERQAEIAELARQKQAECLRRAATDLARAEKAKRFADVLFAHVGFVGNLIAVAEHLEAAGAEWRLDDDTAPGGALPKISITARSRFSKANFRFNLYDAAGDQLAAWADEKSYRRHLAAEAVRKVAETGCNMKWLLEQLPGVDPKQAKHRLLDETGYAPGGSLGQLGRRTGYFIQRSKGRFAKWVDLTVDGVQWAADCYATGELTEKAPTGLPPHVDGLVSALRARQAAYAEATASLRAAETAPWGANDRSPLDALRSRHAQAAAVARLLADRVDNYAGCDPDDLDALRRRARDAASDARDLGALVEAAQALDDAGIAWDSDGRWSVTAAPGTADAYRFTAFEDAGEQIAAYFDPAANAARRRQERLAEIDVAHKFKWVAEQMPGIKYNLARTQLLFESGFANDCNGDIILTQEGEESGFFVERGGQFGSFLEVTPAGMAWMAEQYLGGALPMQKKNSERRLGPELEHIVATWRELRGEAAAEAPAPAPGR